MSNDAMSAAEALGKLQQTFGALLSVQPQLLELGSLEQAKAEATSAVAAAQRDLARVKAQAETVENNAKRAQDAAAEAVKDAEEKAKAILHEAEVQAQAMDDAAASDIARARKAAEDQLANIAGQVDAARAELKTTEDAIEAAQAELAKVNEAIAAARAAIGA